MSLIESALQKLRRSAESGGAPRAADSPATAPDTAVPALRALPELIPVPDPAAPVRRLDIDLQRLCEAGYVPHESAARRFADHYRHIKRPLIEKALGGPAEMRLVVVSSALPGDGKTFTSMNLALSIARERDFSALLVDADAPRAHVSEVLGVREEPGLLDALRNESLDVLTLIQHTDIRGLEVLPAGQRAENATELFASSRMAQIATRLLASNPRRMVIIDSAPLLVTSEGRALLRNAGQIVLVVRSGVTPQRALQDALGYVNKSQLQGIVLNQVPSRKIGSYAYYAGYYDEPGSDGGGESPAV